MENVPNAENPLDLSQLREDFAHDVSENEREIQEVALQLKKSQFTTLIDAANKFQNDSILKSRQERIHPTANMMQGLYPGPSVKNLQGVFDWLDENTRKNTLKENYPKSQPTTANGGRPNPQNQFDECHGITAEEWKSQSDATVAFGVALRAKEFDHQMRMINNPIQRPKDVTVKTSQVEDLIFKSEPMTDVGLQQMIARGQRNKVLREEFEKKYQNAALKESQKKKSIRSFVASTWRKILNVKSWLQRNALFLRVRYITHTPEKIGKSTS